MVPRLVIEEIRAAGLAIDTLDQAARRRSDEGILAIAQARGRVLLTLDRDFWGDKQYPLDSVRRGLVYVEEAPDQPDRILRAFGLVYGCFAKSYPLDWWEHMKVRSRVGEFEITMRTWRGTMES